MWVTRMQVKGATSLERAKTPRRPKLTEGTQTVEREDTLDTKNFPGVLGGALVESHFPRGRSGRMPWGGVGGSASLMRQWG